MQACCENHAGLASQWDTKDCGVTFTFFLSHFVATYMIRIIMKMIRIIMKRMRVINQHLRVTIKVIRIMLKM